MNTLRYLKLQNDGRLSPRLGSNTGNAIPDGQGNVSFAGEGKSWYTSGYRDILQYAERSVDLAKDSNIPNGSQVRMHVYVVAGYSNPSVQQYLYDETSGVQAVYEISGTTGTTIGSSFLTAEMEAGNQEILNIFTTDVREKGEKHPGTNISVKYGALQGFGFVLR